MERSLPKKGFVFWPVGTGDSTSIILNENDWIQVDLHSTTAEDGRVSIIDELVDNLPKKDGKPYLSVFALTHPDLDHCEGFEELMDRVTIGEIWFTPRIFTEHEEEFCSDACVFKDEALRRVRATSKSGDGTASGDKAKIIGFNKKFSDEEFPDFPDTQQVIPGTYVQDYDGNAISSDELKIFIHAPLKDAIEEDRNNTSLAMQVSLNQDGHWAKALLLGDLAYLRINKIFEISEINDNLQTLEWNILLAPHHCSKSVMYHKDGDGEEEYKKEIIDKLQKYQDGDGIIISSSEKIPASNKKGDNPPHAKAKAKYLQVVSSDGFVCTQEHSSESQTAPVVVEVQDGGVVAYESAQKIAAPYIIESLRETEGEPHPPSEPARYG